MQFLYKYFNSPNGVSSIFIMGALMAAKETNCRHLSCVVHERKKGFGTTATEKTMLNGALKKTQQLSEQHSRNNLRELHFGHT